MKKVRLEVMMPELSIIICSYRNPHLLGLCIDSIRKNVVGIDFEVIVADGQTGEEREKARLRDEQKGINKT